MRILIVTDAWHPQVNGVVSTIQNLVSALERMGIAVELLTPEGFRSLPLPTYADIRLAVTSSFTVGRRIAEAGADHVHIVTEGPLGLLARRICVAGGIGFTTSYHTRFPEYLSARVPVPENWSYRWLRRFHNAGEATMVATPSLLRELSERGFTKLRQWNRGVDTQRFHLSRRVELDLPKPIFLSVGRLAPEKNLPAFLGLDLPGTKLVVGDGPERERLQAAFPDAVFVGAKFGEELAAYYASADVFVFPSRTDTFGLVILEALASGLPVAGYPVTGPADILADGVGGVVSEDLREACLAALAADRHTAREKALRHGWDACASLFLENLRSTAAPAKRKAAA
ncbi:glycosyltransferase family 1 protein [Aquamicrobium sp. LC103]|uniref:glycosyltransferase family 4 protein n=1 Tax=Aquamicrobium sp. LC103 TaxID=1120658 RepID=UPI00063E7706|nr:glycosyltransferase family 1 protein [Aquamicrobium sp. LC103]TKT79377.1 glycosyltransferase family 1 protein [Aquamicrobium sp. LC103]